MKMPKIDTRTLRASFIIAGMLSFAITILVITVLVTIMAVMISDTIRVIIKIMSERVGKEKEHIEFNKRVSNSSVNNK